ncbi:MAG: patatin family protein [Deltaproteobacteria bacterium]|nr:patatin family protein [Deltaproteobacteria bacterium]
MDLENAALILEGGGLRGIYTSGILRFFMDRGIFFPYVIGVSMGACNAANYVSRQPERNRIVNTRYVNDARYLSYWRLLIKGELFGMDFIFDTIPNSLVPFDFETFMESDVRCITTVVDCETGEALYYEKNELGEDYFKVLRASTSLPFMAKSIHYKGRILMDGGLADSVPIRKSLSDGNSKHVIVLTRPKGYRKKRSRFVRLAYLRYSKYKGLCEAFGNRHTQYNETMDFIDELEEREEIFVIRPRSELNVGRAERNKDKLYAAYDQGYADGSACYGAVCSYLNGKTIGSIDRP